MIFHERTTASIESHKNQLALIHSGHNRRIHIHCVDIRNDIASMRISWFDFIPCPSFGYVTAQERDERTNERMIWYCRGRLRTSMVWFVCVMVSDDEMCGRAFVGVLCVSTSICGAEWCDVTGIRRPFRSCVLHTRVKWLSMKDVLKFAIRWYSFSNDSISNGEAMLSLLAFNIDWGKWCPGGTRIPRKFLCSFGFQMSSSFTSCNYRSAFYFIRFLCYPWTRWLYISSTNR